MIDLRPIGYIVGLIVAVMGAIMLVPLAIELALGGTAGRGFLQSAALAGFCGGLTALACANRRGQGLDLQQTFVLTNAIWAVAVLVGTLPFLLVVDGMSFTDAIFEATSGLTTTGASVLVGLDGLSKGLLIWRAILQWLGGLGILILAMIFLPVMKVGGMQFFKTEGFDTLGKVMPRALDIAQAVLGVYTLITVACVMAYAGFGMSGFDAVAHALTTVSTGGFSTSDASFSKFSGPLEYVATVFMFASSLPFIRFVQLYGGSVTPMWHDPQVRGFARYLFYMVALILVYRLATSPDSAETIFRTTLFNVTSMMTGTGFASAYIPDWGPFAVLIVFVLGFVGGCTGSSSAGASVFRFQVLFLAIGAQIRQIHAPHRLVKLRYGDRILEDDVIYPVIAFFSWYFGLIILATVVLALSGLDFETAVFASWTSLANIGAAIGPGVMPSYTMLDFPDLAKWVMIIAMMLGRLGILSVLVILLPRFWRS